MRRTRVARGTHSSINISGLDVIEEEIKGLTDDLGNLRVMTEQIGTSNDTPEFRKKLDETMDFVASLEQSVLSRLKMEISPEEFDRHGDLEDKYFEVKSQYYGILAAINEKKQQFPVPMQQTPSSFQYQAPQIQPQNSPYDQYQPEVQVQNQFNQNQFNQNEYNQNQQFNQFQNQNQNQFQYQNQNDFNQNQQFNPYQIQNQNQNQFVQADYSSPPPVARHSKPLPPPPSNFQPPLSSTPQTSYLEAQDYFNPPPYSEVDESANSWLQQQALANDVDINGVKLLQRDSVYWNTKEIENRNQEMQFVSSEMVHLAEVMQDMATEVNVQAEQIDQADEATEVAQENTKEAVKVMGKSAKNASKVLLPGIGGGVGVVAGAVVGGVIGTAGGPALIIPGIVMGAAVGAGIGGGFGAGAGKVIRNNTDKEMHKARLNDSWQPDKLATNCQSCQKKFSQILRKHHCRNCGGCFCDSCSKHKMHIPGVDGSRQRVCTKCFEAIMYFNQGVAPPPSVTSAFSSPSKPLPAPPSPPPARKEAEFVVYGGDSVQYEGGPGF